jgi:hypothetical protein
MANPAEQQASGTSDASEPSQGTLAPPSGVFKSLLAQYGEAFALVKRLGMRSEAQCGREQEHEPEREPQSIQPIEELERGEMMQGYAALRAIVQSQILSGKGAHASDLTDAMAALDAINPGSPEWGPTFLQVSELVEACAHREEDEGLVNEDDRRRLQAAC